MRSFVIMAMIVVMAAVLLHQTEAGNLRLKKLVKYGLIANALTGKKILFPLPLPLPIPIFQENIHHTPYPVNHHTHAEIGYGYEQGHLGGGYGGGFGGGYGGGLGGGLHGGYGGGLGGGLHGGYGGGVGDIGGGGGGYW